MGFGDINSLIKFRDANPGDADQGRVHGLQQAGRSRSSAARAAASKRRRTSKARSSARPPPDGAYAQWKIFTQANGIDASKVKIENVGFPVREPMLQSGQVDAITGFSFSSFINLKDPWRPGRRHRRAC